MAHTFATLLPELHTNPSLDMGAMGLVNGKVSSGIAGTASPEDKTTNVQSMDNGANPKKRKFEQDETPFQRSVRMWHEALDDYDEKKKVAAEADKAYQQASKECRDAYELYQKLWSEAFCDKETGRMLPKEIISKHLQEYSAINRPHKGT